MFKITVTMLMIIGVIAPMQTQAKEKNAPPDFTKGDDLANNQFGSYWALGPIGAMGWFWHPTESLQILIKGSQGTYQFSATEKGSPADGVLLERDVILGIGNRKFDSDARKLLAEAITEAEKTENGGKLPLLIWRPETEIEKIEYQGRQAQNAARFGWPTEKRVLKQPVTGKEMLVTLNLPVLGTYSETTPWECPKTKAIIDKAAQTIVKDGFFWTNRNGNILPNGGIPDYLNALGLLATGEEKYLPMVREYAHKVGNPETVYKIGLDGVDGPGTWHAAYLNLFLTEYYLATKDEYVLPHITNLSTFIALGRSGVGTWSHGMANVPLNGGFFGPATAYGAMNQCSITAALSLVLAQKCGVKKPEIDEAVVKATEFLRWYVDKGTIPYGDHMPAMLHDGNGKNSQAAVLFDLHGDKEAADFFTRMTLASYPVREGGHTGHFFGTQWGTPGAARGGPEAASSFVKNTRYFTELERRHDGRSIYQHQLGGGGNGKTKDWETTGQRLMQHCLPRKQLYITGRGGSNIDPIVGDDLKTVVNAATFNPGKLSVPELLEALGNWSVVVRERAAMELGNREENVVDELIAMLDSPNRYARYGACIGLQRAGFQSTQAVQALITKLENDKDINMRYFAIRGLQKIPLSTAKNGLGEAVMAAAPALLKIAADFDVKQDPNGKLQAEIATILFYSGRVNSFRGYFHRGNGIEKQDPDLVVAAMKAWLTNPNGGARTAVSVAYDKLSEEQLDQIWGEVYYAAKHQAPSGVMFSGGGQANSIMLLAKNRFEEGLPLALDFLTRDGWGKFGRVPAGFEALTYYGSAAREYMPIAQKEWEEFKKRGNTSVLGEK